MESLLTRKQRHTHTRSAVQQSVLCTCKTVPLCGCGSTVTVADDKQKQTSTTNELVGWSRLNICGCAEVPCAHACLGWGKKGKCPVLFPREGRRQGEGHSLPQREALFFQCRFTPQSRGLDQHDTLVHIAVTLVHSALRSHTAAQPHSRTAGVTTRSAIEPAPWRAHGSRAAAPGAWTGWSATGRTPLSAARRR